jgi:hypothetical protein
MLIVRKIFWGIVAGEPDIFSSFGSSSSAGLALSSLRARGFVSLFRAFYLSPLVGVRVSDFARGFEKK